MQKPQCFRARWWYSSVHSAQIYKSMIFFDTLIYFVCLKGHLPVPPPKKKISSERYVFSHESNSGIMEGEWGIR